MTDTEETTAAACLAEMDADSMDSVLAAWTAPVPPESDWWKEARDE
jgi:hypothetical protein